MNSTQRKFLVDKLLESSKRQVEELKRSMLIYPSASNFLFKASLNGTLRLKSEKIILDFVHKKALNAKEGENWLSDMRIGYEKERVIKIDIDHLFELPQDYLDEVERVRLHNKAIQAKIDEILVVANSMEVRIQLASDKTLQTLINEVDDMGQISLVDTKLKELK